MIAASTPSQKSSPSDWQSHNPTLPANNLFTSSAATVYSTATAVKPTQVTEFLKERYDWIWQLDERNELEHICPVRARTVRRKRRSTRVRKAKTSKAAAEFIVHPTKPYTHSVLIKTFNCNVLKAVSSRKVGGRTKRKKTKKEKPVLSKPYEDYTYYCPPILPGQPSPRPEVLIGKAQPAQQPQKPANPPVAQQPQNTTVNPPKVMTSSKPPPTTHTKNQHVFVVPHPPTPYPPNTQKPRNSSGAIPKPPARTSIKSNSLPPATMVSLTLPSTVPHPKPAARSRTSDQNDSFHTARSSVSPTG